MRLHCFIVIPECYSSCTPSQLRLKTVRLVDYSALILSQLFFAYRAQVRQLTVMISQIKKIQSQRNSVGGRVQVLKKRKPVMLTLESTKTGLCSIRRVICFPNR